VFAGGWLADRLGRMDRGWYAKLKTQDCITDVRGDVLRIGFGVYQDESDVARLVGLLGGLA
jgi:selenocysteine lyase/cysteine desulfurase